MGTNRDFFVETREGKTGIGETGKGFNVTADFLLGISDKPDHTTFYLAELGLTIEFGRAFYISETNTIVINALLGCKSFPALAQLLRQYMEGTAAEGYATQSQLHTDLAAMIARENTEATNAIKALKAPPYQVDIAHIRNMFDRILVELMQNNRERSRGRETISFRDSPRGPNSAFRPIVFLGLLLAGGGIQDPSLTGANLPLFRAYNSPNKGSSLFILLQCA